MHDRIQIDRRSFLQVGATAAGGLLVSVCLPGRTGTAQAAVAGAASFKPDAFVQVDTDGSVTIWSKNPDMGEGIKTSMPMIVADELDADWSRVRVVQAELDQRKYGGQGSGGSWGIMSDWDRLRKAGALARELLVAAAAAGWGVAPSTCRAREGRVRHDSSGRSHGYGELAAAASRLPVPATPSRLKDPAEYRLIGSSVTGVDTPKIVVGEPLFGIDQQAPGMLHAVVEKCPVFGGRPVRVDTARTMEVPGVRRVVTVDGLKNPTHLMPGVAVVADSIWAAMKGRDALSIDWDEGPGAAESSERLRAQFVELASRPGQVIREAGDVERALQSAAHRIDVVYETPFLAHATLEPQNCLAHVHDGRCEVWGSIQMPDSAQEVVAEATGLPLAAVTINVTRIGGGFGRRLLSDYAAEAAVVSKAAGAPVQVVWTREDDLRHDYYRPAGYHHVRAGLDARGRLSAWHYHLVGVSRNRYRLSTPPEGTELYGLYAPASPDPKRQFENDLVPCLVRDGRVEFTEAATHVSTGAWRAPAHNANAFVIESVLDELAHLGGVDPVDLRLSLLGRQADFPFTKNPNDPSVPYDPDRVKRVLKLAAEKAGWGTPLPAGRGRGIAVHYTFSGYAAHVAEVTVAGRRLTVDRVVSAVDCGLPVHRSGVEAQTQGGVLDGLNAALFGEMPIANGRATKANFDTYRMLRNREAPDVEVHIVPSREHPSGFGEIPLPPIAPAVTNAIFAATGTRIRKLPIVGEGWEV